MFRRHRELWYALAVIVAVTAAYLVPVRSSGGPPAASSGIGHGLGVVGIALMLVTEVAYSLRKQSSDARWGNIAGWLRFHIVTGLVGPYLVLLHTAMRFRGLAGLALLATGVVVASGIFGRYVYTAIPRLAEGPGAQLASAEAGRLETTRDLLATWRAIHVPLTWALFAIAAIHAFAALYYGTLQR